MKDLTKLKRAVELIESVRQSCFEAISGAWDKSDEGFQDMVGALDIAFNILSDDPEFEAVIDLVVED